MLLIVFLNRLPSVFIFVMSNLTIPPGPEIEKGLPTDVPAFFSRIIGTGYDKIKTSQNSVRERRNDYERTRNQHIGK